MTPECQLLQLYEHWRTLSERERDAIQAADWTRLAEVQAKKLQLQEDIMRVGAAAAPAHGMPRVESRHRAIGDQLILLEQENSRALAEKRQELRQQLQALDQASHNLHQVHRAYAQGREPAWQSYS
jgi:hypothetical protein